MTGDGDAFLDCALPHLAVVFRVARQCESDSWAAEDLVQETLLRAFASYEPGRILDVRAWLVTICLNTARSNARQRARRVTEVPHPDLHVVAGVDRPPEDVQTVDRLAIQDALDRLPDEQRLAIVLTDVAGLTAAEAATVLECPRGTVLARVHRGRRRLARLLAPGGVVER